MENSLDYSESNGLSLCNGDRTIGYDSEKKGCGLKQVVIYFSNQIFCILKANDSTQELPKIISAVRDALQYA